MQEKKLYCLRQSHTLNLTQHVASLFLLSSVLLLFQFSQFVVFCVCIDADVPDAGQNVVSVSRCCGPEVGQTGGTPEGHLHHQG